MAFDSPDGNEGPGTSSVDDDIKFLAENTPSEKEDDGISDELKGLLGKDEDISLPPEDEEKEETPEEEEEETPAEEEEEEEEEITDLGDRPSYKELVAKYPDIFKSFPTLKQSIFREREYTEVFPTVADAKLAAERVGFVDRLSRELINDADPTTLFKAVSQAGGDALPRLIDNILPNVYEKAPALYERMTKPLMVNLVHDMFESSGRNETPAEGERLTNGQKAALILSKHLFGEAKLPERIVREEPKEDPEKKQLQQELIKRDTQILDNHVIRVKTTIDKALKMSILARVDPKNVLPPILRETMVEKGIAKLMVKVGSSPEHSERMTKLWLHAKANGYPEEALARIRATVLARSKALLPSIVTELTKGIRKSPNPDIKKAPKGAKLGAGNLPRPGKVMTAKELNKSGMSDAEFLRS